jgi:hypothetical protein
MNIDKKLDAMKRVPAYIVHTATSKIGKMYTNLYDQVQNMAPNNASTYIFRRIIANATTSM